MSDQLLFILMDIWGVKNMVKKMYWTKLSLTFFVLVVTLAASGTTTAAINPNTQLPDAYVLESGKMFTGPTAIQDSIDSSYTMDGHNIYIKPGNYSQEITVTKSITLRGMGTTPEDTKIEMNTTGNVINVPEGVTVTLKNMAIINNGGMALSDGGIINLINCVIIENYMETTIENTTEIETENGDTNTLATDTTVETQSTDLSAQTMELTTETELTSTDSTATTTSDLTSEETTKNTTGSSEPLEDGGIPFTTMAYGMLMVVGGVVLPRKH